MTELKKKAEEYFYIKKDEKIPFTIRNCNNAIKQAYKDGYEQGQKDFQCSLIWKNNGLHEENEELKAQIEKMKTFSNCKHWKETQELHCMLGNGYCICDKWELV